MTKESIRIRGRKTATKQPKTNIFIGCEGFETEPNYFNEIKNLINKDLVEVKIVGFGQGIHGALIKCKRVIENNPSYRFITWDHIWIVCDKDKTSDETFNDYILQPPTIAGLTVEMAWSNPSFELWYLLHFTDINLPTNRERYATSLSGFLGSLK